MEAHRSLLFDLSLTPGALLKEMPPDNRSDPSFAQRPPLPLTRSVNPLLNVRRRSVDVTDCADVHNQGSAVTSDVIKMHKGP